jgi:hypothetical protein
MTFTKPELDDTKRHDEKQLDSIVRESWKKVYTWFRGRGCRFEPCTDGRFWQAMTWGKEAAIRFSGQLLSNVTACHDSNALSAMKVMRANIVCCLQDNVLLFLVWLFNYFMTVSRSQWPLRLWQELSSPAQTLGSWVRIPLQDGCLYVFIVCLFCSVC